jgi:hypothetical protein
MKMRSFFFLSAIALLISGSLYGQSYTETALLFSRVQPGGSARIQALGGTQISLGGDYSSAFSNPAGLGMYNRSEFSLSVGQRGFTNDSRYFGQSTSENDSKLNIPGFGAVFNVPSSREGGSFIGGSFAISFNRTNDFNNRFRYSGGNRSNSIIDSFLDQAWGDNTSQFDELGYNYNSPVGLAYYNYLIGPASTIDSSFPDDEYFTDVQSNLEELTVANQSEEVVTSGASNQWSISYGANFFDRIFVGAGIGITSIRYTSEKNFTEDFDNDVYFNGLSLEESVKISGSGINATLGVIARPVDFLQIGFAYTTPTYYELNDSYEAFLSTSWKDFRYYENRVCDGDECNTILRNESAGTDVLSTEYNFRSPSRISAGVTLISKIGFISGDVEYGRFDNAKYNSEVQGVSFAFENDDIQRTLKSALNVRLGAEYRYKIFRVRAGFASQGNAFANESLGNSVQSYSGGVGVRLKKFFADFAIIRQNQDLRYSPYYTEIGELPIADIARNEIRGLITVGITY